MEKQKESKLRKVDVVVFLDFDGTLTHRDGQTLQRIYVGEVNLLKAVEEGNIPLLPGALEALHCLVENGYKIIINSLNYTSVIKAALNKADISKEILEKIIIYGYDSEFLGDKEQVYKDNHTPTGRNLVCEDDRYNIKSAKKILPNCTAFFAESGKFDWEKLIGEIMKTPLSSEVVQLSVTNDRKRKLMVDRPKPRRLEFGKDKDEDTTQLKESNSSALIKFSAMYTSPKKIPPPMSGEDEENNGVPCHPSFSGTTGEH